MVVGGSVANGSNTHDANQQPTHAAFFAGFPDFELEVVPLKVRKDGEKFKLANENAAVARAKWNPSTPVHANKAWNNIRVLQKFGGLKIRSGSNAVGDTDDTSSSMYGYASPRYGPPGNSDAHLVHRETSVEGLAARRATHQP